MDINLLLSNITNPAFMFFLFGIVAVRLKSDLEIPANSSRFISLYLLFSIGFRGGQELSHENFSVEIVFEIIFGILISVIIPVYVFFLIKKKFNIYNAAAIAAAYGSVSAVTFVTGATYLENEKIQLHGHMVAIMAMMEAPAIITGLLLLSIYNKSENLSISKTGLVKHSFTNGSVLMILGSLLIGLLANAKQAEGIKPFTNDLFKGFLAIFLLDMGISSGKNLKSFVSNGWTPIIFASVIPIFNGVSAAFLSSIFTKDVSDKFMFAVLAASASYIAVPAALKLAVPKADPGLYLPMTLAITFPVNITVGMPLYLALASC
jgi:uncharacterized protein